MVLTRVELENFTAFTSLKLDLSPGVNVLVGANGTGKTHLMKVCYAGCETSRSPVDDFAQKLAAVFLPSGHRLKRLVRRKSGADGTATVRICRGPLTLEQSLVSRPRPVSLRPSTFTSEEPVPEIGEWGREPVESVYIPVKEMLSNAPGFRSLYARREIHFEETYRDVLDRAYLPALREPTDERREGLLTGLQKAIGGRVLVENEEFFLRSDEGEIEFSLLAEGMRKLALLWLLIRNGTLPSGSVLFWDEPGDQPQSQVVRRGSQHAARNAARRRSGLPGDPRLCHPEGARPPRNMRRQGGFPRTVSGSGDRRGQVPHDKQLQGTSTRMPSRTLSPISTIGR